MKSKTIPKIVLLYLGLIGFHIGTVFSVISLLILPNIGLDLLKGVIIYIIGWLLAVFMTYIIGLRSKETIETWIPFLKEKKKK